MTKCHIKSVGKRRDGGTRYWCFVHHADATAKYGRPAFECRYAHVALPTEEETLSLVLSDFPGGVALWGAVPPVYDTTALPADRGIHVHARLKQNGDKIIDKTFRGIRIRTSSEDTEGFGVDELDAIYFMVSKVFNKETRVIKCTKCGYSHLDKDWFSVHAHKSHLCAGCGMHFSDLTIGVGNPLIALQEHCESNKLRQLVAAKRKLEIHQKDYPDGIQIWGSNPAIVWTSTKSEEEGIHVHAYKQNQEGYAIDNTYDSVSIDGIHLDAAMVRKLMAQNTLPHIEGRVKDLVCPYCHQSHFDSDDFAFTPHETHLCEWCGREFKATGRTRKTIGNPLIGIIERLSHNAPRQLQKHNLGLLPETI